MKVEVFFFLIFFRKEYKSTVYALIIFKTKAVPAILPVIMQSKYSEAKELYGTVRTLASVESGFGRALNWHSDRYRANPIHNSNNDNSNNNVDGFNNLGRGSLSHIFRCGSKHCQFENKFVPVNNILSTTTNRLYKCIVPAGSTYIIDHSSNVVYLITCNKCKL